MRSTARGAYGLAAVQLALTAVVLALGGSALELRAFAAPRTAGIWDELRGDIMPESFGKEEQ